MKRSFPFFFSLLIALPMWASQPVCVNNRVVEGASDKDIEEASDPLSSVGHVHRILFSAQHACDSPTHYEEEPECTEFIAKIPVVWDQSVALTSKVGEYVAMVCRSGNTWYVGVINNWTARDLTIDLSPLDEIPPMRKLILMVPMPPSSRKIM